MHYKGKDADKLMVTGQIVIEFEIDCLLVAVEILERRKKMNTTSLEEDLKCLEQIKAGNKWRWAECLYYRINQKRLLDFHIESYKLLVEILKNIQSAGSKYKEGYMKLCPKYEKDETEATENRLLFKDYLRQLAQARKLLLGIPYES